jgi:hypothetical protein
MNDTDFIEKYALEYQIFLAIKHKLKPIDQNFVSFILELGARPQGYELRRKSDGKRAPYRLNQFYWEQIGMSKRVDSLLSQVQAREIVLTPQSPENHAEPISIPDGALIKEPIKPTAEQLGKAAIAFAQQVAGGTKTQTFEEVLALVVQASEDDQEVTEYEGKPPTKAEFMDDE